MKLIVSTLGRVFEYPLAAEEVTVGRHGDCQLHIDDKDVSRRHCRLIYTLDSLEILDLGSANGTYVNGLHVERSWLHPGDTIQLGGSILVVASTAEAPDAATSASSEELRSARRHGATSTAARSDHSNGTLTLRVQQLILLSQRIASELDLQRLLEIALGSVIDLTCAESGLLLVEEEVGELRFAAGELRFAAGIGLTLRDLEPEEHAGLFALIAEARRTRSLTIPSRLTLAAEKKSDTARVEADMTVCLPLFTPSREEWEGRREGDRGEAESRCLGFIYLRNRETLIQLDALDRKLLQAMMAQAAIAIQNAQLYQQATTEPLTNLLTRATFILFLQRELRRARARSEELALAFIDIDHFKSVNDRYGHQVGDEVLEELGGRLRKRLRRGDLAGRYGGEEFLIALPRTGLELARKVIGEIRQVILAEPFASARLTITVSIGVAIFPHHAQTSDRLIKHADQALYQAKHSGRDRIVVWTPALNRISHRSQSLAGILGSDITRDQNNLTVFFHIAQLLNLRPLDPRLMEEVLERIIESFSAERAVILLGDRPEALALACAALKRGSSRILDAPVAHSIAVRAFIEQRSISTGNLERRSTADLRPRATPIGTTAELITSSIPMFAQARPVGVLILELPMNAGLVSADLALLEAIAGLIALAVRGPATAPPSASP